MSRLLSIGKGINPKDRDLDGDKPLPQWFKMQTYLSLIVPRTLKLTLIMKGTTLSKKQKVELDWTVINQYHSLDKRIKEDWDILIEEFLKQYDCSMRMEVTLKDLELL